jgi:hypothetical protein
MLQHLAHIHLTPRTAAASDALHRHVAATDFGLW